MMRRLQTPISADEEERIRQQQFARVQEAVAKISESDDSVETLLLKLTGILSDGANTRREKALLKKIEAAIGAFEKPSQKNE